MARSPFLLRLLVLTAVALVLAGCATAPRDDEPSARVDPTPADLTLDVVVLAGADEVAGAPAQRRAGRIVLFPDGSLHYGDAATRARTARGREPRRADDPDWLPPRVRTLDRPQVAGVWQLMVDLGYGGPEGGRPPFDLDEVPVPDDGVRYVIDVTAGDERWTVVEDAPAIDAGAADEIDPASADAGRFVRRLLRLAWASELVEPDRTIVPTRYDLGPDPYARFRRR